MISDHVEHRGFDQTFHVVVFFVLNYVHCLLQVISFYMLFFNKEFVSTKWIGATL
jgi:hypothetical protein